MGQCWNGSARRLRLATERFWPLCLRKGNAAVTLWEVDIHPAAGQRDLLARAVKSEAADLGLGDFAVHAARGFLVQGEISAEQIEQISRELLTDLVVETPVVGKPGEAGLSEPPHRRPGHPLFGSAPREGSITRSVMPTIVHVLPKPGVTDPVAASTLAAIGDFRIRANA